MRPPLKLNSIDQEHLQELYNAAGIARDELPYTDAFENIWQGFQDRTFKNAARDQLFAALLKYTRSSTNAAATNGEPAPVVGDEERKKLKSMLPRHSTGGKVLPYSDEFEAARKEFNKAVGANYTEREFWRVVTGGQGSKRKPPVRKAKVVVEQDDDDDVE